jgi:hypothetical protein
MGSCCKRCNFKPAGPRIVGCQHLIMLIWRVTVKMRTMSALPSFAAQCFVLPSLVPGTRDILPGTN